MQYRKEIDGLRALAVIPVILFHAGLQTFSGGFVGVDIFFVISGYLITLIILSEKQAGTFTLPNFYERRARRILPALFFVMLICLPLAWVSLMPHEMKNFSSSLISVSVFLSNIFFYKHSGYFDTASELQPLLHTWSLAVEEQYYLIFPIFMMLSYRFSKKIVFASLFLIFLFSLGYAQYTVGINPTKAFFLLPSRFWELLIGAFVAFYYSFNIQLKFNNLTNQAMAFLGLLMLIYSIAVFDKQTPFPSLYALIPTVGTALIIMFATNRTIVGQFLANKLFVGIGLISYSAYLWHQPLFAFARHKGGTDEPGSLLFIVLVLITFGLAYLSWKYVEQPFRNKQKFSRRNIFLFSLVGGVMFILLGVSGRVSGGYENRLSDEQLSILKYKDYNYTTPYRSGTCFLGDNQTYKSFSKECGTYNEKGLLIWGDSHAAALTFGFRTLRDNVIQYTASGCPPIVETLFIKRPNCKEVNDHVLREIKRLQPEHVILHARWGDYGEINQKDILNKTISNIKNISPYTSVVVVGPVPEWKPSLPLIMLSKHLDLSDEYYMPNDMLGDLSAVSETLMDETEKVNATYLSPLNVLCESQKCLVTTKYNHELNLTAWDYGHLTEAGAYYLADKLLSNLTQVNH